jgi:hypothetical protein
VRSWRVRYSLFLLLSFGTSGKSLAVGEGTMVFLTFPQSPQANGMAGILTTSGCDDPLSPLLNPAAIGLMAQRDLFNVAFYPSRTPWWPGLPHDMSIASRAMNFGLNEGQLNKCLGWKVPISAGIGYHEIDFDLGETTRYDEYNNPIGTVSSGENSKGLALGIAVDYHVNIAIGWNYKHAKADYGGVGQATGDMSDFGVLAHIPVVDLLHECFGMPRDISPGFRPMCQISTGYSTHNVGKAVRYSGTTGIDPLTRTAKSLATLALGLVITDDTESNSLPIIAMEWGAQGEDILLFWHQDGSHSYRTGMGDIDYFTNVIGGRNNDRIAQARGWELNLFDSIYFRKGRYDDAETGFDYDTEGHGFRLAGFFRLSRIANPTISSHPLLDFVTQHIDIQYSWSKWKSQESLFYTYETNERTYESLSICFRY